MFRENNKIAVFNSNPHEGNYAHSNHCATWSIDLEPREPFYRRSGR